MGPLQHRHSDYAAVKLQVTTDYLTGDAGDGTEEERHIHIMVLATQWVKEAR